MNPQKSQNVENLLIVLDNNGDEPIESLDDSLPDNMDLLKKKKERGEKCYNQLVECKNGVLRGINELDEEINFLNSQIERTRNRLLLEHKKLDQIEGRRFRNEKRMSNLRKMNDFYTEGKDLGSKYFNEERNRSIETETKLKREIEELEKNIIKCTICMSKSVEPYVLTRCGHQFCDVCLQGWEESKTTENYRNVLVPENRKAIVPCPVCKKAYNVLKDTKKLFI